MGHLALVAGAFAVLGALTLLWIALLRRQRRRKSRGTRAAKAERRRIALNPLGIPGPARTLAVLGSGGHTMEMLEMTKGLKVERYAPLYFVVASTDKSSERKVRASAARQPDAFFYIPRSREVGQSYLTSVATTLHATFYSWYVNRMMSYVEPRDHVADVTRMCCFGRALVWRLQPDLVLCNGPGTCLPLYLGAFLLKVLWKPQLKLVFVESFCRVKTLSLTGKIIYALGISDEFVVHWPELRQGYRRAKYLGQLF
eukprot:scaffold7114_cov264-Pinguiococcus_pyrenoidosus.AAC.8